MKTAGPQDWNTEALPDKHVTIDLHLVYSKIDRQKIFRGLIPNVMEEKWFVYYYQECLNFHRSWTGYCIYRVHCRDEGNKFYLTHAEVNREKEQYIETDDEIDRRMISYLIDVLLLGKPAVFPSGSGKEEDVIKIWSSIGKAMFTAKAEENPSTDFVRIIPVQRFVGFPASPYRPYAFYADAASLKDKTIADCYSLVHGLRLPPLEPAEKYCTPFLGSQWNYANGGYDNPLADIIVKRKKSIIFEDLPLKKLGKAKFVVLRVSRSDAVRDLDVFPATWRALSFIVSDPKRMGARQLGWDMELTEYASARIHALFKEVQVGSKEGLLASTETKSSLGLNDLEQLPGNEDEHQYYAYLSRDSGFTNRIVELFGISCRCWHGCGYIGSIGNPICRFYLLRNKIIPDLKFSIMKGTDILP